MNRTAIPSLIATSLLSACAGGSLTAQSSDRFTVNSEPAGAVIYVMGKEMGNAPLEITTNQVFPATYPKELESHYGRVELRYPGCEPYARPISGHILANGLTAMLDCNTASMTAPAGGNIHERLRQLKEIFDEGLISEAEYRIKREGILQDL